MLRGAKLPGLPETDAPDRIRSGWVRLPAVVRMLLVFVGALLVLGFAWQGQGGLGIQVGRQASGGLYGFDPPETNPMRSYRWSTGPARVTFSGVGAAEWNVELMAAAGTRPEGAPPLKVQANGTTVLVVPAANPDFQLYTFTVPSALQPLGDLALDFDVPTFQPPGENRELALAVEYVQLRAGSPVMPAPVAWLLLAGLVGLVYTGAGLVLQRGRSFITPLMVAVVAAAALCFMVGLHRLQITPYAGACFAVGLVVLLAYFLWQSLVSYFGVGLVPAAVNGVGEGEKDTPAPTEGVPSVMLPVALLLPAGYALLLFA